MTDEARYDDYASTANPILAGLIPAVPYHCFAPDFFERDSSGILPLDVSDQLKVHGPATSPALLANFVRIVNGSITTSALATSQLSFPANPDHRPYVVGDVRSSAQREGPVSAPP